MAGRHNELTGMILKIAGIQAEEAGLVNGWRVLSDAQVGLSFPLRGNRLSKPLDSGLRRNDEVAGFYPSAGLIAGLIIAAFPADPLAEVMPQGGA